MRTLWRNRDTASRAQQLHVCPCHQYTWRHNQVLREVCEAAKAAVSKANSRTIANQRKIYFLREGFAHLCRKRCQTPRRYILAEANDWTARSQARRDEALPPGADRKWQEVGFGARVVVDGCHHSGGADGTVGGQALIQQRAQSR